MFAWQAIPALAATLIFWMLGCYVLTRGGYTAVALLAFVWQASYSAFFLGEGMRAHAATPQDWLSWSLGVRWAATLGQVLFLWLTLLLLHDLRLPIGERFLRLIGYPLGIAVAGLAVVLIVAIYLGDWVYGWSEAYAVPLEQAGFDRFAVPVGPLYPLFSGTRILGAAVAAVALGIGWRRAQDPIERTHFGRILLGLAVATAGASTLIASQAGRLDWWPSWASHLVILAALGLVLVNVASYSLLVQGRVIGHDLLRFAVAVTSTCLLVGLAYALSAGPATFTWLRTAMLVLLVVIFTHSAAAAASATSREVQETPPVPPGNSGPDDHPWRKPVEEALRNLGRPSFLGGCDLAALLPFGLAAALSKQGIPRPEQATPLEIARAVRAVLTEGIERMRPEHDGEVSSGGATEYDVLHAEYVRGLPTQQIMTRYSISAATFHRIRRRGVVTLAADLATQEVRHARRAGGAASPATWLAWKGTPAAGA